MYTNTKHAKCARVPGTRTAPQRQACQAYRECHAHGLYTNARHSLVASHAWHLYNSLAWHWCAISLPDIAFSTFAGHFVYSARV